MMNEKKKKKLGDASLGQESVLPPSAALKALMGLVRPYLPSVMGTAVVGAMTIVANTGLLAVSAILISISALMPPLLDLMPMSAAVRLCGISRALFRYWERLASHSITLKLLADLRVWYYQQLLPLVPGGVRNRTARLFKTITDDIEILKFFYLRVVAAPLTAVVALVIASVVLAFFWPPFFLSSACWRARSRCRALASFCCWIWR